MKMLKKVSSPSNFRLWYNQFIEDTDLGSVLDVGKSQYWDYGFSTIDKNKKLNPTFCGDICNFEIPSGSYDTVLCNGMYECVEDPQKMIDECVRIAKKMVVFGFVGKGYKPYKKDWHFFEFKENLPKYNVIRFNDEYYFLICNKV